MSADRPYDEADVQVVASVLHQEGCEDPCPGNCANDARAVLETLTAAGRHPAAGEALDRHIRLVRRNVRREVAEEIAQAIEAYSDRMAVTGFVHVDAGALHAARIAREVGGTTGEEIDRD